MLQLRAWTRMSAAAVLLAVTAAISCGGSGDNTVAALASWQPPASGSSSLLDAELARLEELPTPDGADPVVFAALKTELADALRDRGVERFVSAPPMTAGSAAFLSWDDGTSMLSWGYCCLGDYNQNSLVEVADITPMGVHWAEQSPGFPSPFPPDTVGSVVDGNGNGLIEVADITPIGQNYDAQVTAYNVYASSALADYPGSASDDNGGATMLGSVPFPEGPPPQGQRRFFSFAVTDPQPETYFWVRPTDGTSEGTPSNYYYLSAPANISPVASLTADPLLGDVPMVVEFDASLSHDPDGEIVKFEWDWDGANNGWVWEDTGTTAIVEHTFEDVDVYQATVRVTDDQGGMEWATVQINATAPGNDPPVAVLTADPTSGEPPLTVSFDASGSYDPDGAIVKYEWDWDGTGSGPWDEDTGAIPTTSHVYAAGYYTAWVKVTDELGGTASDSVSLSAAFPAPWPMFGHDPQRTRRSPYVGAQTNNVKWSYTTGDIVGKSSPAVGADGTVYVGSHDNNLYAINPDGSLKWSYPTGGDLWSSPAIGADGTVYVGSHDDNLYAINPDGSLKWSYTTGGILRSSPAIGVDGTVYVGSFDGELYALNPDGSLKWSYTTGHVRSSPAIGTDGTVYVGSNNKKLYALNPDGSLKWSYTAGWLLNSSPAIGADGTVYEGSDNNKLYAINPDGSLKWSYTTGSTVYSSPAIGTDGTVYVGSQDNKLYALNPDGSLKWSGTTGGGVFSSPAIGADGTVYVGSEDNKLYALNQDGSLKWSYTTGDGVISSPAIGADGTVYVGSDDGKLYAFGPSS